MNERYAICKKCEEFNDTIKVCKVCHCFMPVKTRIPSSTCPLNKWGPINAAQSNNDNNRLNT